MQRAFLTYLKEPIGLHKTDKILLAVSGGVDSMVMLALFARSEYEFSVAHCNFQLRGEASEADEQLVRQFCKEQGIPFFTKRFFPLKDAADRGISMQMAARDLRYLWFDELKEAYHFNFIATAHHAEDSFETALLNLVRGTGISGLKGILPISGQLIRPLLFAEKEEILAYAKAENVLWREDESNASNKYKRNLIRHEISPKLKEINPSLFQTFFQSAERIKADQDFIEKEKENFERQFLIQDEGVFFINFTVLKNTPFSILYRVLERFDFDFKTIQKILAEHSQVSGLVFESNSHEIFFDREKIFIVPIGPSVKQDVSVDKFQNEVCLGNQKLSFHWQVDFPKIEELKDKNSAFLDVSKLKFPLTIRKWKEGDRFQPFGMKGTKLVSDILIDNKVPMHKKRETLVLCSDNEIIWLVNHRIAEKFCLDKETSEILKISTLRSHKFC